MHDRITSDIACFLVALEAAIVEPNAVNFDEVRSATDRLMRAAARTRLELERLLASRHANAFTMPRSAVNGA